MTDYSAETYESLYGIWFEGKDTDSLPETARKELEEDYNENPLKEDNFKGFVKRGLLNKYMNWVNQ